MNPSTITLPSLWLGFGVSLLVSVALVLTQQLHGHLSTDTHEGIQKFHTEATPRVGGVAIFLGTLAAWFVTPAEFCDGLLGSLIVAGLPALVFGLLEDITKQVSVRTRLLATMACGVLGYCLTGFAITSINVYGLDWLFGFTLVSLLFTAFAVGGVANAINIIDGFNGLSSGTVIIICGAFAYMSLSLGDVHLARICLLVGCVVLGFLLVNWPWGKIFLGDGGAYFVGFALAWVAVMLLARHTEVSAWAPMLVCGYPVLEVIFSMVRRRRRGHKVGAPDRLHLHSLVMRRVVMRLYPHASQVVQNSLTGSVMWLCNLGPVLAANLWPTNTPALIASFAVTGCMYCVIYVRLTQFVWCVRPATMREVFSVV